MPEARMTMTLASLIVRVVSSIAAFSEPCYLHGESGELVPLPRMQLIPGGAFLFGSLISDESSPEYHGIERPQRRVEVPMFYLSAFVVTALEYCRFLNEVGEDKTLNERYLSEPRNIRCVDGNFQPTPNADRCPALGITWVGAQAYCEWLSKKTGKRFRLPTEVEWEYAARGPELRPWPWGDEDPTDAPRFGARRPAPRHFAIVHGSRWLASNEDATGLRLLHRLAPVDFFPLGATPHGVHGMAGFDYGEWCADIYQPAAERDESTELLGVCPDPARWRVVRGFPTRMFDPGYIRERMRPKDEKEAWRNFIRHPPISHEGRSWSRFAACERYGVALIRLAMDCEEGERAPK
jgi:formylglycine-generating enzyme required for sulfatase activity